MITEKTVLLGVNCPVCGKEEFLLKENLSRFCLGYTFLACCKTCGFGHTESCDIDHCKRKVRYKCYTYEREHKVDLTIKQIKG